MDSIIYLCETCDEEFPLPEETAACPFCGGELRDIALEWVPPSPPE
jgi:rRNA maturation endonuclease Nob1